MTAPASVATDRTRIGWIGTGVMGRSMCRHVLAAGYRVTVYARRPDSVQDLISAGADLVDSPAAVAAQSDVIITMVSLPRDVRAVILGEDGALSKAAPGTVLIDMTTSEPSLAKEIYAAAQAKGTHAIDAPVSGGDIGARSAGLSMMIGGDAAAVEAVTPLLLVLGPTIVHQGPAGAGQHAKASNQIIIAGTMIGICEALLYAYRAGLDPVKVLASVSTGAAGSNTLTSLAPRMIQGDYAPGFYVEYFRKDLGIALAESRAMNLALPGTALAEQLYQALAAQGHSRSGTQALILALADLSRVDWQSQGSTRK